MWVKATASKFEQYGIQITTQRQLNDGEYIMHMELTEYPEFFINTRFDEAVKLFKKDEIESLLVDDNLNELNANGIAAKEQIIFGKRQIEANARASILSYSEKSINAEVI